MEREIAPGNGRNTDADLDAHIRANSITVHHPLGTCKMGVASDPMAVVDPELRVFGTEGLRVVDGSVMPDLVGAHINAPDHHDRGKGRRPDPRPPAARSRCDSPALRTARNNRGNRQAPGRASQSCHACL